MSCRALDADLSVHEFDQFFADGKAQSCAAVAARFGSVGLGEWCEQALLIGKAQTDTGVGHGDLDQYGVGAVVFEHDAQHHAAGVGELDGIADQVGQHLADPQ